MEGLLRGETAAPRAGRPGDVVRAGLPATELALHGPEGGEPRQDRQPGRGGHEAAGGTAGGQRRPRVATRRASPITM